MSNMIDWVIPGAYSPHFIYGVVINLCTIPSAKAFFCFCFLKKRENKILKYISQS